MEKRIISLALAFSAILNEWLTPEQMQEVLRRNKTPKYIANDCCATHDFCDPNQAVIDAYKALGHETPLTPDNDDPEFEMKEAQIEKDINEVNKMWKFAAANDFFVAIYQPNYAAATGDTLKALSAASSFMAGFVDDDAQDEPVDGDLEIIDREIARLEGKGIEPIMRFIGIEVEGGIVQDVYSNVSGLQVAIIDRDDQSEEGVCTSSSEATYASNLIDDVYLTAKPGESKQDKKQRKVICKELREYGF